MRFTKFSQYYEADMPTLEDIAKKHKTDKLEHGYCAEYAVVFGPL